METQQATLRMKERLKLLAYHDARLGVPVFVDLVFRGDAPRLDDLARQMDLTDLVDVVRKAHAKLPRMREVADAEREVSLERTEVPKTPPAALPDDLVRKRFVLPSDLEKVVADNALAEGRQSALRPVLVGRGEGTAFRKLGILGRAALEEQTGTSDLPFYYASLLVVLRYLADVIQHQLVDEGKVKTGYDEIRGLLQTWTAKLSTRVRRGALAERVLSNPLAPYAFCQRTRGDPVEATVRKYLSYPNEYALTPELAEAFDEHFAGMTVLPEETREGRDRVRQRVLELIGIYKDRDELTARGDRLRRTASRLAAVLGLAVSAGLALSWLPSSVNEAMARMLTAGFLAHLLTAIVAGAVAGTAAAILGFLGTWVWPRLKPAHWNFRRALRGLKKSRPLRSAFARAMAREKLAKAIARIRSEYANSSVEGLKLIVPLWKNAPAEVKKQLRRAEKASRPPARSWIVDIPRLLWTYLKLRDDRYDLAELSRIELPPQDFPGLYQSDELWNKWSENACVCYEDDFPNLIVGAARTAAVYFIDVAGSTEIASRQTLSNALEIYSRVLPLVNESGGTPLWRKEVGDGRYYCYPISEALRRAVLTAQSCAHSRVMVPVGIGLSVSEIYTDVTTGDFLNEAANRASRLNSRDETVRSYLDARYAVRPFNVYVKYGRLFNAGIALDEKALHALGIAGWRAVELVPPLEMRFPVLAEGDGTSSIAFHAERLLPSTISRRLEDMGNPAEFAPFHARLDQALVFEVFCDKPERVKRYRTPGEGHDGAAALAAAGAQSSVYLSRELERESSVGYQPVALPSGQMVNLVVKYEKANLKGLGATAIAEVSLPPIMPADDLARLESLLSSR